MASVGEDAAGPALEVAGQSEAGAPFPEEPDQDFASCPHGDDEQEDINPPYELLEDAGAGAQAMNTTEGDAEPGRLASLRVQSDEREQSVLRQQQISSPGSHSAAGTEDVAGQLQQLISVVGVLANRLERIEAASGSDTSSGSQWSDTVNLGYVDQGALDRWYNQALREWTGPAGCDGGCPPTPAPSPPAVPGQEFPNPWYSGPAGWFRQFGSWMGPWNFTGQAGNQPSEFQVPQFPGSPPPPPIGVLSNLAPATGALQPQVGQGQVPPGALQPQVGQGQVPPGALQPQVGQGQVPPGALQPQVGQGQVPPGALQPQVGQGQVPPGALQPQVGQGQVPPGALQPQVSRGQVPPGVLQPRAGPGQMPPGALQVGQDQVPPGALQPGRGQVSSGALQSGPGSGLGFQRTLQQGAGQGRPGVSPDGGFLHPVLHGHMSGALSDHGQLVDSLTHQVNVPARSSVEGVASGARMASEGGGDDAASQVKVFGTQSGRTTQGLGQSLVSSKAFGSSRQEPEGERSDCVLQPGTKVQIVIDGRTRDATVNSQGGLELAPDQFYIGSLRGASLSPPRDHEVPPPPQGSETPRNPATPGGTPVPSTPAPRDSSPGLSRGGFSNFKPEEPARHVAELPPLSEPKHRSQGAVLAGDWIVAITPSMIQLSASAQEWWSTNVRDAREQYALWLEKTPQERLKIKAEHLPKRWTSGKFVLVEQRGISLLMKSLPEAFRDQLVSSRLLYTSAILFQIYCKWQPGGALEKSQLLEFLVTPEPASSALEAAEGIRKWQRLCRRGHELDTVLPDPSLLLRGLDILTGQFLQGHNVVSFRVAAYRNDTGVDFAPNHSNVSELADFLLAECEALSIAEDPKHPPAKRPRAAKAKAEPPTSAPNHHKSGAPSAPVPKAAAATLVPCRDWGTAKGCKKGANCGFHHDKQVLKGARRCWNCSSEDHLKPSCPYLPDQPSDDPSKEQADPKARGESAGGKGKSGGKGGQKAKAKATAEVRKAQASETVESTVTASPQPETSVRTSAQEEFLKECTDMVRSLKLKALRSPMTLNRVSHEPLGLLDTGATASMRRGTPNELARYPKKAISLAVGEASLAVSEEGTLLTEVDVEPLVCVADLVSLGCKLVWEDGGCYLDHPRRGRIMTKTHNRCPEIEVETALNLITDIEVYKRQVAASVGSIRRAVLASATQSRSELNAQLVKAVQERSHIGPIIGAWLAAHYPEAPSTVLETIAVGSEGDPAQCPWNRRKRRSCLKRGAYLHVFAGSSKGKLLRQAVEPCELLEVDIEEDLAAEGTWAFLLMLATSQRLFGVFGGPPCRTQSLCRHFRPGPRPLRAPNHWHGLPGLDPYESQQVLYDDGLVVRMLALYEIGCFANELEPFFGLEQPADPAAFMPDPRAGDVDARVRRAIGAESIDDSECISALKVYSCLWRSPLWQGFEKRHRIRRATFPLGHQKRKPTCLAANVEIPQQLSLASGPGTAPDGATGPQVSGQWAKWAPGFVTGLCAMLQACVSFQVRSGTLPESTVRAVRDKAFEQHLRNDHQPWRRDCEHCVAGGFQGRLHKRVRCPEGYVLSLDLLGRYDPGPSELHKGVQWCLVGCFVVPELGAQKPQVEQPEHAGFPGPTSKGIDLNPVGPKDPLEPLNVEPATSDRGIDLNPLGPDGSPDSLHGELATPYRHAGTESSAPACPASVTVEMPAGPADPQSSEHWHDSDLDGYAPSEGGGDASLPIPALYADPPRSVSSPDDPKEEASMQEEWDRKASELRLSSSPTHELHFVVPIQNKTETSVLDAVALVLTQIQALGYQCVRVHSDKGREFANKRLRNFLRLRGIYKTTSEGDDYKGNGRVEGAIRRLKQQARVLLHSSGLDHKYWAFALQHAAARQRALVIPRLGGVVRTLLPFGTRVFVRRRTWDHRHKRWEARGIPATVLAPSLEVTRGHVVLMSTGELMTTSTLLVMKPVPSEEQTVLTESSSSALPTLEPAEAPLSSVQHRITSKRKVVAAVGDSIHQEDTRAQAIASSPTFDSAAAVSLLLDSHWLHRATSPSQRRILIGGSSHVFGLFRHGGVVGLTSESTKFAGFLRLLHALVRAADPLFEYTSLTLLSQVRSLPHKDIGNVPGTWSLLLPLSMPSSGGHLWVEDPDGNLEYELPSGRSCWGRHVPLLPLQPVRRPYEVSCYAALGGWP